MSGREDQAGAHVAGGERCWQHEAELGTGPGEVTSHGVSAALSWHHGPLLPGGRVRPCWPVLTRLRQPLHA